MAESWVRLWAGSTTDPKWQTIARKSGQPRYLVIALFTHLLMVANDAEIRGDISALSVEDTASALDCEEEQIAAILDAMDGRVINDWRLTGWEKRQPSREDFGNPETGAMSAAERKRLQRQREKEREVTTSHDESRRVTTSHAPEAEAEAEAEADTESDIQPPPPSAGGSNNFPMGLEWSPSAHFRSLAKQAGLPMPGTESFDSGLAEFRSYWLTQPTRLRTQHEWDHALVKSLKAEQVRASTRPPARASPSPSRRQTVSDDRKAASMILTGRKPENERPTANNERDITGESTRVA